MQAPTPPPHPWLLTRRRWLAALAAWPASAGVTSLATARPLVPAAGLQLAVEAPADADPEGFLVSEKFDGVRALWTGSALLFRSGLPVAAPAWFTAALPQGTALDGELWLGRGRFEVLSGTVRRAQPDDAAWRQLRFMAFDMPHAAGGFALRSAAVASLVQRLQQAPHAPHAPQAQHVNQPQQAVLQAVDQQRLPSPATLQQHLAAVVAAGGEGLVLQRADAPYTAGRSGAVLKLKPLHDAEAIVVGHQPGRGKHAGRLGALRVRTAGGVEFLIGTGFSDAQRQDAPAIGSVVTFTHRGVTAGGVPRFASFLRERSL